MMKKSISSASANVHYSSTVLTEDLKCKCCVNNYRAVYSSASATLTMDVSYSFS